MPPPKTAIRQVAAGGGAAFGLAAGPVRLFKDLRAGNFCPPPQILRYLWVGNFCPPLNLRFCIPVCPNRRNFKGDLRVLRSPLNFSAVSCYFTVDNFCHPQILRFSLLLQGGQLLPPPKTAIRQIATGGGAAFGPAAGPALCV